MSKSPEQITQINYLVDLSNDAIRALPTHFESDAQLYTAFTAYLLTFPDNTAFRKLGNELPVDMDAYIDTAGQRTQDTFYYAITRFALKMYL